MTMMLHSAIISKSQRYRLFIPDLFTQ